MDTTLRSVSIDSGWLSSSWQRTIASSTGTIGARPFPKWDWQSKLKRTNPVRARTTRSRSVSTSRPSSSTHKGNADLANEGALSRGQVHTFTSCLEAGLVKDDEARRLHHVYWSGADQYLSVFDPSQDTYEK